jgi:hypothetical protein
MKMKKLPSEANSEKGDLSGEGRLGENRELMDKNRIEGRHGASRGHNTPKTPGMPVEVNSAAVRWSNVQLPGEISRASAREKSAEVIVVGKTSRGRDARSNNDTGGLTPLRSVHAIRLRICRAATAARAFNR